VQRYYRSRKTTDSLFASLDALLVPFFGYPKLATPKSVGSPKRLLLADGAHLGDTIIIASMLPALREEFPTMEIGLLTGSWNRELLEGNVHFDRVHFLDHWYMNRSAASRLALFHNYAKESQRIVAELKTTGYDVAINMRPWFPNLVPVIWRAGIPVRVGFNRSGFIFLFNTIGDHTDHITRPCYQPLRSSAQSLSPWQRPTFGLTTKHDAMFATS
jgi:ADP-heptose:LPS heptosyltransferase